MTNFTAYLGLKQAAAAQIISSKGEYMSMFKLVRHLKIIAPKVTPEMKKRGWAWVPAKEKKHL